jgi:hypothetical protein
MLKASEIFDRYRFAAVALLASAALHAAVFVGMPPRIEALEEGSQAVYSASIDPAALTLEGAPAAPAPRRVAKPRPRSRIAPPPQVVAQPAAPEVVAVAPPEAPPRPAPVEEPKPEVVALAVPAAPITAPPPPKFPVEGLPHRLSVTYALTSAFADGRAVYEWSRDAERYEITSEAEAVGFFAVFLEGRIRQESSGTVTEEGLRPQRFVEHRPNADDEGVEFDWAGKQVTFKRGSDKRTEPITGNSVDWLSMIFQLAHVPPAGETFDLQVFTQRRFYQFQLKILGVEDIEIPLGKVRALHLRHENPEDQEVVDVWLGVDQHNLPVKLRFPVARNRVMVEQVATDISER